MELGDLPVLCLALILSWLSPAEVVRASLVNRAFLEAANSDSVWDKFLPPNWNNLVSNGTGTSLAAESRRATYDRLCLGVFIQENKIYYWLHRPTGGICTMLSAKSLYIVWGEDERYWDWRSVRGSRFDQVAHLLRVCWLEIGGRFRGFLGKGTYTVSFRLHLLESQEQGWGHRRYGWDSNPLVFTLSTRDEQCSRYLTTSGNLNSDIHAGLENLAGARVVEDGWMEYDAGQFEVDEDSETEVSFKLTEIGGGNTEIPGGNWKSGLFVDGVVIKPSYLNP